MKYRVVVDTIELYTRRYTIEANSEDEAQDMVEDQASTDYEDSFESLSDDDNSFEVVEVTEE